jgi:hypothetical protein
MLVPNNKKPRRSTDGEQFWEKDWLRPIELYNHYNMDREFSHLLFLDDPKRNEYVQTKVGILAHYVNIHVIEELLAYWQYMQTTYMKLNKNIITNARRAIEANVVFKENITRGKYSDHNSLMWEAIFMMDPNAKLYIASVRNGLNIHILEAIKWLKQQNVDIIVCTNGMPFDNKNNLDDDPRMKKNYVLDIEREINTWGGLFFSANGNPGVKKDEKDTKEVKHAMHRGHFPASCAGAISVGFSNPVERLSYTNYKDYTDDLRGGDSENDWMTITGYSRHTTEVNDGNHRYSFLYEMMKNEGKMGGNIIIPNLPKLPKLEPDVENPNISVYPVKGKVMPEIVFCGDRFANYHKHRNNEFYGWARTSGTSISAPLAAGFFSVLLRKLRGMEIGQYYSNITIPRDYKLTKKIFDKLLLWDLAVANEPHNKNEDYLKNYKCFSTPYKGRSIEGKSYRDPNGTESHAKWRATEHYAQDSNWDYTFRVPLFSRASGFGTPNWRNTINFFNAKWFTLNTDDYYE